MRQLEDGEEYGPGTPVPVTTLDALIATHGVPRFCKVDVEGFEPLDRVYLPQSVSRDDLMKTLTVLKGRYRLAGDIWAFEA